MSFQVLRLVQAAIAAACVTAALPVLAQQGPTGEGLMTDAPRALTPEDIVNLESFGRAALSPDGRWAIYEKRGAFATIPHFGFAQRSPWAIMDLWIVDLDQPDKPPQRLLPSEGPGLLRAAWSPTGEYLLIYRFQNLKLEVGVVSMADRSVRWTELTPDIPGDGRSFAWIADDRAVVMTRPDGSLPTLMRFSSEAQPRTADAWARTVAGDTPSRTVVDAADGVARAGAAEPPRDLIELDFGRGSRRRLASGDLTDFEVSPDGEKIAVIRGGEDLPIAPEHVVQSDSARRQRLSIIDLETDRVVTPAEGIDVATGLLRWSPDSAAVLVWARHDGTEWSQGDLAMVTQVGLSWAGRGSLTPGDDADIRRGVRADWLGDRPVLFARAPGATRFDWRLLDASGGAVNLTSELAAPPGQIAANAGAALLFVADGALWRTDGQAMQRLTDPGRRYREAVVGDAEAVLRLKVNDAPRRDWAVLLDPDGDSVVAWGDGRQVSLGAGSGAETRAMAVSQTAVLAVARIEMVETLGLRTGEGTVVLDSVNGRLSDVALATPVPVPHLDRLGRPTRSMLFLPRDRSLQSVRGLIVQVYPGGLEAGAWPGALTLTYGLRPDLFVGAGFAVLSPLLPGDVRPDERGEAYVQAVDLAVDAALAAYPDLPPDRIAILGHSFGGYAALEIATRSSRYRSYVASSSISDMFGMWGETMPVSRILPEDGFTLRNQQGWVETGQGGLEAPPWSDPDAYVASSPFLRADRITAPILLLTADRDYVPMSQAERMFSALYRLGGRTRLVTYWGEGHAAWSPANIQDRYRQVFDWLDETLAAPVVTASAPTALPRLEPRPRTPQRPGRESSVPSP